MAEYRVINPTGDTVGTKDFDAADDAYSWFKETQDNTELGWRLEVNHDGDWAFVDDSEGTDDSKSIDDSDGPSN